MGGWLLLPPSSSDQMIRNLSMKIGEVDSGSARRATLIFGGGGGGEHLFCLCFGNLSALPGREERGWISAMRNPLSVSPGRETSFLLQRLNVEGGTEEWQWRWEHTCLPWIKAHNTQMNTWKVKILNRSQEMLGEAGQSDTGQKYRVPNPAQDKH